jgi:PTS system nitrogen regulatory IIA component
MTTLTNYLIPDLVRCDLASRGKNDALKELGELLAKPSQTPDSNTITKALVDREQLATTGVGDGVAIPHAKLEGLDDNRIAVGISRKGIPFDAVDDRPVNIFFALVAPISSAGDHLRILAQISRLLKDADVRARLIESGTPDKLIEIVRSEGGEP